MSSELKGVKGWLAVFLVILGVLSPIGSVLLVYFEFRDENDLVIPSGSPLAWLEGFVWLLVATEALIGWWIVYRLLVVREWRSVRFAVAALWARGAEITLISYVGISSITGAGLGAVAAALGPRPIVQPFLFAFIWTAYLLMSERVASTCPQRAREPQADVFE